MATLGARLASVEAGVAEIELPFDERFTQQDGYVHAGVIATVLDSACGYAAFTLMGAESRVLTVELKANFLAPARGDRLLARGRVLRAGRTLTICSGDAFAYEGDAETHVATVLATMIER